MDLTKILKRINTLIHSITKKFHYNNWRTKIKKKKRNNEKNSAYFCIMLTFGFFEAN